MTWDNTSDCTREGRSTFHLLRMNYEISMFSVYNLNKHLGLFDCFESLSEHRGAPCCGVDSGFDSRCRRILYLMF